MKVYQRHKQHIMAALLFSGSLTMHEAYGEVIKNIRIEGSNRVESETILSYVSVGKGDQLDQSAIDQILKDLYATGYFTDVQIDQQNGNLVIKVLENPMINRVAFEGNDNLPDQRLKGEVNLRPREVLSRAKIQAVQYQIQEIYRRMGYYGAKVEPKIVRLDQNRVDLVFEIKEGEKTLIRKISFVGNKAFKPGDLEKVLYTKEAKWYRFFATDDVYDPDRLKADKEALRQFYLASGYPDFKVISAVAELSPGKDSFYVTYTIDEGERHRIGKINVSSNIAKVKSDEMTPFVGITSGDWFSSKTIESTITDMTAALAARGFAFAEVQPQFTKNAKDQTVDISFIIREGQRVYVERIEIIGNDRTRDYVIRRELPIHEGDAFNVTMVQKGERNLRNLGYFSDVRISVEPGSAPDKARVIIQVEEQPTGEFVIAAGYSNIDGILGNLSFSERNFMGKGYEFQSSFLIAAKKRQIMLGLTDPYFMGKDLAVGASVYNTMSHEVHSFTQTTTGGQIHMGYDLSEYLGQTWTYTLQTDKIRAHKKEKSDLIKQQEGTKLTSAVGHKITYDRRDNFIRPTSGYILSLSNDFAGVGGEVKYFKNEIVGSVFYSPMEEVILNLRASAGAMFEVDRQMIRVADSFFIGDKNFRGFEYGGVGPRDKVTNDALGATRFWHVRGECEFPLGLPSDLNITGAIFSDIGSAWKPGNLNAETRDRINDSKSIRVSAGFGFSWLSPFGPFQINFTKPIVKEKFDDTRLVLIGFTTRG